MYKNQLQELAQRSCFNLPSYACVREGPDHAPRFKASVNFHGEIFQGPSNCTTVRQAEHAAAEVALNNLSNRGPSRSLAARVLDETGVYKNLLQETAHRAGLKLPVYTTVRTGPGHQPIFTCTVELAAMSFTGEPAKTKKQAEKNAALAAWCALRQMPDFGCCSQQSKENDNSEDHEQVIVSRVLAKFSGQEENKSMNQRNTQQYHGQQYQRRRVMLGSRECLPYSHNSVGYRHKWMSLGSSSSSSSDFSINYELQIPKQSCLIAHTGVKRLPAMPLFHRSISSTQESISSKDNSNSFLSSAKNILQTEKEDSICLQKQIQKDEEQQIARKQPFIDKLKDQESYNIAKKTSVSTHIPLYARAFPQPNTSGLTQIETRHFTSSSVAKTTASATLARNSQTMQIPNMFATGGFHASGIAPAVNIRTVIPVCAAPPMRPAANGIAATKNEQGEVSAVSSMLRKLQL